MPTKSNPLLMVTKYVIFVSANVYQQYRPFMDGNSDRSLEDKFFEYEVSLNKDTFMQQFNVSIDRLLSLLFGWPNRG
jgi:hypothetical protein